MALLLTLSRFRFFLATASEENLVSIREVTHGPRWIAAESMSVLYIIYICFE